MGLMTLAGSPGSTIELTAEGPQVQAAMDALARLIESGSARRIEADCHP